MQNFLLEKMYVVLFFKVLKNVIDGGGKVRFGKIKKY